MAASVTVAAAAPPLFPTPPTSAYPALLPTPASTSLAPSIRRFAPSPASPAAQWIRRAAAAPAGRASASESWVRDKVARAGLAPMESTNGSKIPGRASLSTSWVRDKLVGTGPSYTPPATRICAKRILTPSSSQSQDWNGKKQRYDSPSPPPASDSDDSGSDSELEYYALPAFLTAAPHPRDVPVPALHLLRRPKLPIDPVLLSCY